MASSFHRGLPITFKATAVSNLLLGRRGRPLTAKFNEFRKKMQPWLGSWEALQENQGICHGFFPASLPVKWSPLGHPSNCLHFAQITYSCIGGQIRTNTSARSLGVSESQCWFGRQPVVIWSHRGLPALRSSCGLSPYMFFVDLYSVRKTFKSSLVQSQLSHHLWMTMSAAWIFEDMEPVTFRDFRDQIWIFLRFILWMVAKSDQPPKGWLKPL